MILILLNPGINQYAGKEGVIEFHYAGMVHAKHKIWNQELAAIWSRGLVITPLDAIHNGDFTR